jgi:hypothetical protein
LTSADAVPNPIAQSRAARTMRLMTCTTSPEGLAREMV